MESVRIAPKAKQGHKQTNPEARKKKKKEKEKKSGMALITAKSHEEARECVRRHALLLEKQSSLSNLFSFITAIVIRNN